MIFALKPSPPLALTGLFPSSLLLLLFLSRPLAPRLPPSPPSPLIRRERKEKKEGGEGEFGCGQSVLERSLRRPLDRPLLPHRTTDGRSLGRRVGVPPYPHNERTNDLRERRGVSQGSSILFIHPFMLHYWYYYVRKKSQPCGITAFGRRRREEDGRGGDVSESPGSSAAVASYFLYYANENEEWGVRLVRRRQRRRRSCLSSCPFFPRYDEAPFPTKLSRRI